MHFKKFDIRLRNKKSRGEAKTVLMDLAKDQILLSLIPLIYGMDINEIINNIFNFQQNIYDSNFRYTVIPLSRETQGPLLSLVCFINNEPYNWISVYFHAEVQAIFPLVFPRGY